MSPICLFVAGVVRATLPDSEFILAWDHSVEKTRWEERYRAVDAGLVLTEARVKGSGAGMEPPAGAVLRDGWWTWDPGLRLAELRLARSSYTRDYTLCSKEGCRELGRLVGEVTEDNVVVVRPCAEAPAPRSGSAR